MGAMAINETEEGPLNGTLWISPNDTLSRSEVALCSMCLVVSLIGMLGNGTVFFFLLFFIKRNRFTVYILNLSVADFMFLICSFVVVLCFIVIREDPSIQGNEDVSFAVNVFFSFGYNTSLYLLTAISMERCLSVIFPLWYQCSRPKHLSAINCALLWCVSITVTLVEFLSCDPVGHEHEGQPSACEHAIFIFMCLLNFLIFAPLMVVSSVTLLVRVKRDSKARQSSKLYAIVLAAVLIFLLFALPMRVLTLLQLEHLEYPTRIALLTVLFSSFSSTLNPFVYFFVGGKFQWRQRSSLRTALQAAFKDETDSSQSGTDIIAATTASGAQD